MTDDAVIDPANRRLFSRVDCKHAVTLTGSDGQRYEGYFNNVSLRGMLFVCQDPPPCTPRFPAFWPWEGWKFP